MTLNEKRNVIDNIIKPISVAIIIGTTFTLISSLFLPMYESYGSEGHVLLTGISAIKKLLTLDDGYQTVVKWFVTYFVSFSTPAFIGIIIHIFWTKR